MIKKTHNTAIYLAAYALPFLFVMAYDSFIMERSIILANNDSVLAMIGQGLNVLTGEAIPYSHHPAYLIQELSAVLLAMSGTTPDAATVDTFFRLGILTHVLVVFVAAWWAAVLSLRQGMGPGSILVVAVVTASMPTMILFSAHFSIYFLLAVFFPPMAIALRAVFTRPDNDAFTVFTAFFGVGLAISILLLSAVIAAPVVAALITCLFRDSAEALGDRFAQPIDPRARSRKLKVFLGLWSVTVFVTTIGLLDITRDFSPRFLLSFEWQATKIILLAIVVAVIVTGGTFFLIRRHDTIRILSTQVGLPVLAGVLLGTNVFAVYFPTVLYQVATQASRGFQPDLLVAFLGYHWWHGAILFCIGAALVSLAGRLVRRTRPTTDDLFLWIFAGLGTLLSVLLAAGPAADYASQVQFGLASRFAIAIIAMVVVTVLWIADSQRIIVRNLVYVSLLSLSALSFLEYVGTIGPDVERRREIVADLDAVTTQFLASNPNGVVLCPRNEVSSVCMAGYAFNRARTRESLKKLPSEWLFDGRVRYLYSTRRLPKEGWNGIDTALLVDWSYQINTIKDSVVENRRVIYSKAGYEASIIPIEQSMRAPDS
jgi:hypothetical protein